jgi:predicted permease
MLGRSWRRVLRLDIGGRRVERDVDQEIAFHLEMKTRKLVAAGWEPDAARDAAVARFGDLPAVRDACITIGHRRERTMEWSERIAGVRRDVTYALRALRRQPSFTAAVVLILGLGIGANTTVFTITNALVLRTLPVRDPEQLVTIGDPASLHSGWHGSPQTEITSYPVYADVRDRNHALAGLYTTGQAGGPDVIIRALGGGDAAIEHPNVRLVSTNFFAVLGVGTAIGRTFAPTPDDRRLGEPVAVISHGYWQRRFAGDTGALGRQLSVNGVVVTIAGVTRPGFAGDIVGEPTEIWLPMALAPAVWNMPGLLDDRTTSWLTMVGRLRPGVTLAQARTELVTIAEQSMRDHVAAADLAELESDLTASPIRVEGGARGLSAARQRFGPALRVLMGAVTLVVLIVCANVANLMLVRTANRRREMTVRLALGAGRARLLQQLLTEGLVLATAGGVLGVLVAILGTRLLLALVGGTAPSTPLDVGLDGPVLAFTGAITLLCAVLFALAPALGATRLDVAAALRAGGRSLFGTGARMGRFGAGNLLVIAQIGLSTLLLVGSGLLARSIQRILTVDLGMDREHLVVAAVDGEKAGYGGTRTIEAMRAIAARIERIPGVAAVAYSQQGLYGGSLSLATIGVPGFVPRSEADRSISADAVGPGYFGALGARLLRGRDLDARDTETSLEVAVINDAAARMYFRDADPIGRTVTVDGVTYTVVGVVQDVRARDIREAPVRQLYTSILQMAPGLDGFVVEVRTSGDPARVVPAIRDAILAVDRTLRIEVEPLRDRVRRSVTQDFLLTKVAASFAIVALVLAAVGLYGVTTYATTQRMSEFGLRVALGAEPGRVTRMVLGESLRLATIGLVVGIPAALAGARLIRAQLFGIGAIDPPSLIIAIAVLVATAAIASWLPARRAATADPLTALRAD